METQQVPLDCAFVNEFLQEFVGRSLTAIWRGGGQAFDFGDLTVKCLSSWTLVHHGTVIMGSGDHKANGRRFYDRFTAPRNKKDRARWERAVAFLERVSKNDLIVKRIQFDASLTLTIRLSGGYTVRALSTSVRDDHLYIRLDGKSMLVTDHEMVLGEFLVRD